MISSRAQSGNSRESSSKRSAIPSWPNFRSSCTNGEQRLRKFGHDGIADRFDDDSLELPDCARDEIIVTLYQQQSRCVAEAIEVVGRADDVGEKDGALCLMTTNFFVNLRANLEELVDVGFLQSPSPISHKSQSCVSR